MRIYGRTEEKNVSCIVIVMLLIVMMMAMGFAEVYGATTYSYIEREGVYLDSISVDRLSEGMVKAAMSQKASLMVTVDPDVMTLEQATEKLFEGGQPYFLAIDQANEALDGVRIDAESDAVYYDYPERNLLVFELIYR